MVKIIAGGKQGVEYKLTNWSMSSQSRSPSSKRLMSDERNQQLKAKADRKQQNKTGAKIESKIISKPKSKLITKQTDARYPKRRPCKVVDFPLEESTVRKLKQANRS